ncbi:MAG: hypothetical protein GY750_06510 [Lentisphaerae bacterium]|nr:hypothetical protein [Lentisphaerota bacterium]MCP4101061.1 hypothetical protein [Lentisphaerota bacterium]
MDSSKIKLYHAVPSKMHGKFLVPLSELQLISETLYNDNLNKYPKQAILTNQDVEFLHCQKKDVLFLTPIHPFEPNREYQLRTSSNLHGYRMFEIPLNSLDREKLVVYVPYDHMTNYSYVQFDEKFITEISNWQHFNKTQRNYWLNLSCEEKQKSSHLFTGTAIVLYRGKIDISSCQIIAI